jgi:ribosome biogenesis SPOUT family RNA methylase Rps3
MDIIIILTRKINEYKCLLKNIKETRHLADVVVNGMTAEMRVSEILSCKLDSAGRGQVSITTARIVISLITENCPLELHKLAQLKKVKLSRCLTN